MKSLGTINLEFGMLNLPLAISGFADYQTINFSNVCSKGHDIKIKRWCEKCNKEIQYNELKKAYKINKDNKIIFDSELINYIKEKQDKSCKVLKVLNNKDTNQMKYLIDKVYYLIPKAKFEKGYFILLNALIKGNKTLLIDYFIRNRKHIGLVEPFGKFLVLLQLIYVEQIRTPTPLKPVDVSQKDVNNALLLLESIEKETRNIKLQDIKDEYTNELFEAIIKKKKPTISKKEDDFSKGLEKIVSKLK